VNLSSLAGFVLQAVFTAFLAALIGQRFSMYWHLREKRRELALDAQNRFWRLYGQAFVIWKRWNYSFEEDPAKQPEMRAKLLDRIMEAEAEMEGILLKLISERELADHEVEAVAKFRQGYQRIRWAIRHGEKVTWSDPSDPPYVSLKRTATAVSYLISTIDIAPRPDPRTADANVIEVTAQKWENLWEKPLSSPPTGLANKKGQQFTDCAKADSNRRLQHRMPDQASSKRN
jgi:hypothetical protein